MKLSLFTGKHPNTLRINSKPSFYTKGKAIGPLFPCGA